MGVWGHDIENTLSAAGRRRPTPSPPPPPQRRRRDGQRRGSAGAGGVRRAAKAIGDLHVRGAVAHLRHELVGAAGQEVPAGHRVVAGAVPQPGGDRAAGRLDRRHSPRPRPLLRAPLPAHQGHLPPRPRRRPTRPPRHLQRLPPRLAHLRLQDLPQVPPQR